ncbi:MAG: hypothetical protein IKB23_08635, partial [Clostridia bacterium]|nr:hypothetical protein [Clostridia bacterium]
NGSFNLRLVAVVKQGADLSAYQNVGFDVTATMEDHDKVQTLTAEKTVVYSSIEANYETIEHEDLGGKIFLQECRGLTTDYGKITFTVTTFATTNGGERIDGETREFTVGEDSWGTEVITEIPEFDMGTSAGTYTLRDGEAKYYSDVTDSEYEAYVAVLENQGFSVRFENSISSKTTTDNKFATLVNGAKQINLAYYPNEAKMKVTASTNHGAFENAGEYQKAAEISVTQMALASGDGMSYVVTLEDGSFLIIDGGVDNAAYKTELYSFLFTHNTAYAKPRVTWMFTHAHNDHVGLATNFVEEYKDLVDFIAVAYNFASSQLSGDGGTYASDLVQAFNTHAPNAKHYTYRTGDVLELAGVSIEILATHEDVYMYRNTAVNENGLSSVWKMNFTSSGKSMMITGDATDKIVDHLYEVYDSSVLKSDVLQAAHHGTSAAPESEYLDDVYAMIAPDIILCPGPETTVTGAGFAPNAALIGKWIYSEITYTYSFKNLADGGIYTDGEASAAPVWRWQY